MIFRQLIHDDLGCASYLVGDAAAGVAAVVDPRLEIDEYLESARYLGASIEHVLETHNHADHVSGHGRLAAATGASIHIHRLASAEYAHEPFEDGWELELGKVRVSAMHTPGHRPEHTAFALTDTARSEQPWAVLTGDTLFVGGVARPDLAVEVEEGAAGIFESLRDRLLSLPAEVEVWPGHLGGSLCGGSGMDMKASSTVGFERANTAILAETDGRRFAARLLEDLGPQPPNFQRIVEINRGPLLREGVESHPLAPRQVEQKRAEGALVVDVRTDLQFDDAHVPGSVCITMLRAGFGSKLAWVAGADEEIVLVGRDDDDARRAVELAAAVGLRRIGGFLHGGMTSWREERRPVERTDRLSVTESPGGSRPILACSCSTCARRRNGERDTFRDRCTCPTTTSALPGTTIDPDRPVAVMCSSGQRAALAASLLQLRGASDVIHVVEGGVGTWADRGVWRSRQGDDVCPCTGCVIPRGGPTEQEETWQLRPVRESSATTCARTASRSWRCCARRTGWSSRRS